jgi:RsiW-degrading membrane proteinase PrsW (M82 family)
MDDGAMTIQFECPGCGKRFAVPDEAAGRTGRCSHCERRMTIPMAAEQAAASGPPRGAPPSAVQPEEAIYAVRAILPEPVPEPVPAPRPRPAVMDAPLPRRPISRKVRRLPERLLVATSPSGRGFLYAFFVVTMVPLSISLLSRHDDVESRFKRTLQTHPEIAQKAQEAQEDVEDFFSLLPGRRIEGAHLARGSYIHWLYALVAATAFMGAACFLFDLGNAKHQEILWVALATGTFGILFLLAVQWIAALTSGHILIGGGIVMIVFWIFRLIAFSYSAAMDPQTGFWLSFVGFLFGIGLCEEFTKSLPLVFHYRSKATLGWRGACFWGLASGIGFGIAEGIMYSSDFYNGIATGDVYLVRFISCVALHAVWSASAAIMIWRRRDWFQNDWDWGDMAATMFWVLGAPIVLHALYDTLLKREMNACALAAALGSFVWLVVLTESTRKHEAQLA